YWARWAGVTGDVGRFSATCIARWEGANTALPTIPDFGDRGQRVDLIPPKQLPKNEEPPARTQYIYVHAPQMQLPAREMIEMSGKGQPALPHSFETAA